MVTDMMDCPFCGKENGFGSRFCIFCGSVLSGVVPESQAPTPESDKDDSTKDSEALLQEIRVRLDRLENRVAWMERGGAIGESQSRRSGAGFQPPESVETRQAWTPASTEYSKRTHVDWEQVLGLNWLAIIGAIALTIGVGFFLMLAFDNNWIGETGRVILGLVAGVAVLGIGEYAQHRYPAWAQAVTGAGIGILYLSIYAAFGFYDMIDFMPALLFLALVVAMSGMLALRYESRVIALLGMFAAFITPVVLGLGVGSGMDAEEPYVFLIYILLVDLGILGVSTFRNWRWFTLVGLIGSYLLFAAWFSDTPSRGLAFSQIGLTAIFLVFSSATTLFHILWRRAPGHPDMILMTLNAACYFGLTFEILWDQYEDWFALISLVLSLFYGLLGYGALKRTGAPIQITLYSVSIALVFLTVSVPLALDGSWITVAWAVQGATLVWVGLAVLSWPTRIFGLGVLSIALFRLLVIDTLMVDSSSSTHTLLFNPYLLTSLIVLVAVVITGYLYRRQPADIMKEERFVDLTLFGFANLVGVWVFSAEAIRFFDSREIRLDSELTSAKQLSLTLLWAVHAIGVIVTGMIRNSSRVRLAGLVFLCIPVLKLFVFDIFLMDQSYRVAAFVVLGVLLLVTGLVYQRYSNVLKGFFVGESP